MLSILRAVVFVLAWSSFLNVFDDRKSLKEQIRYNTVCMLLLMIYYNTR